MPNLTFVGSSPDTQQSQPARMRPIPKWFWLVCLLIFAIAVQNFVYMLLNVLNPIQTDYSEVLVVRGVQRIMHNPALAATYSFNTSFYNATDLEYPPVFPYLAAGLGAVGNFLWGSHDPAGFLSPLYGARLLTLLGLGWSVFLIYRLVNLFQTSRLISFTAASLFFCFYPVFKWGSTGRVDALGLAFVLTGLYVVGRAELTHTFSFVGTILLKALPLFTLAFFTKQSLVAAPLALMLYLFWAGRRREAVFFGVAGVLLNSLILAVLTLLTEGRYPYFLTVERFTPFSVAQVFQTVGVFLIFYWPLLLVAYYLLWKRFRASRFHQLLFFWGAIAASVSLTCGKLGATDYYLLEVIAFTCVVSGGLLIPTYLNPEKFQLWQKIMTGGQIGLLLAVSGWSVYLQPDLRAILQPVYEGASAYLSQHTTTGQELFVELAAPALTAGRPDHIFDHFVFRQLVAAGERDGQAIVQDMVRQRYKVMVFGYDPLTTQLDGAKSWPSGFEGAIRQHYQLQAVLHGADGGSYAWILVPN